MKNPKLNYLLGILLATLAIGLTGCVAEYVSDFKPLKPMAENDSVFMPGEIQQGGLSGEVTEQSYAQSLPKSLCWTLCKQAQTNGQDLSNGPCLSDTMEFPVENWVCDIAHNPRTEIDNQRENQCNEFHEGKANHFVEYTPDCEFIAAE